jgi:NAD(P)-dependent dehydrogenase (short-subunit alcohol dehydrogenase family)
MDLSGRVAVVTGATGGLGRTVARTFAEHGAGLALLSSDQSKLDALAHSLEVPAERCLTHAADLRDPAAVGRAADAVSQRLGDASILAHLVGGWVGGTELAGTPADDLRNMLDQHVWTTFHLLQAFVPQLVRSSAGRVFVVSSPVTLNPSAKSAPYAAAKSAEEALVLTLAEELKGSGVTANVLQVRAIQVDGGSGSGGARPDEIVAAMLYLCSPEGGRVNGARLPLVG